MSSSKKRAIIMKNSHNGSGLRFHKRGEMLSIWDFFSLIRLVYNNIELLRDYVAKQYEIIFFPEGSMKENIYRYKVVKIIEMSIFVVLEAAFLIILTSNDIMRKSIFVDKSLFIICIVMYVTIIIALGFLIYDFVKLRELKIENRNLENLAFLDEKTGIPNRTSVNLLFNTYKTPDSMKGIGCLVSQISNIREINNEFGKEQGDKAIQDFSKLFEKSAEGYGFVGRNGGNEFISVIEKCDGDRMATFYDRLTDNIDAFNASSETYKLRVRSEYVLFDTEEVSSFSELIAKAYAKLGK